MERIFCETKKILAVILISLIISIVAMPISQAAHTDDMHVGEKYEYTGVMLIVYKNKDAAKKGNIFKLKGFLFKGDKITIQEVDGNVLKIGNERYIKCTLINSKRFEKIDDENSNKSQNTTIPVEDKRVNVESITIDKALEIKDGESATINVRIEPDNATNRTVTWTTSDSNIATVDSKGKVTAKKPGTVTIKAEVNGQIAQCKVTIKKVEVSKVNLNDNEIALYKGETATLKATVSPDNASYPSVTYKSSDTSVAEVNSNGKISAVGKGEATITVTADGKTAKCKVVVKIHVSGVTLNKTSLTLYIGDTETLSETVKPSEANNKQVTWKSDNKNVATVSSNGKITAVAEGTAKITVTTKDQEKTATCTVTVKKDPYKYSFGGNTYKIAVTKDKLDSVLNTIKTKGIYQNNGWKKGASFSSSYTNGKCYRIALCHLDMLLHDDVEENVVHSNSKSLKGSYSSYYDNKGGADCYWTNKNPEIIKSCIDEGKPVIIHTYSQSGSQHWVAAVGYKGNGYTMNDLLFISCTNGVLCVNGDYDVHGHHYDQRFQTLAK